MKTNFILKKAEHLGLSVENLPRSNVKRIYGAVPVGHSIIFTFTDGSIKRYDDKGYNYPSRTVDVYIGRKVVHFPSFLPKYELMRPIKELDSIKLVKRGESQ